MAEDTSLTVQINAETGNATDGMGQVAAALDAILAKMPPLGEAGAAATTKIADGHNVAAAAAVRHAEAEEFLGGALGKVETGTNAMARAMEAVGLHSGEATERVLGVTEALDGVGKAVGPLLAIGAAAITVAAAFNFLKDGVEEAGKAQVAMASLGQSIQNQGGAWSEAAQSGVERYLDSVERATTYSRGEALEALNSLTSAGVSLSDAEKIVAISTDVAAGSHRSLLEVVNSVKEAELGRGLSLAQTDLVLKALIKTHGNLSEALDDLAKQYSGQAWIAAEQFRGKQEQLHNEIDHLGEAIGESLIKPLTIGTEILIGFTEAAEQHEPQIAHFFDTIIGKATTAMSVIGDLATMLGSVGDLTQLANPLTLVQHAASGVKKPDSWIGDALDHGLRAETDLEHVTGTGPRYQQGATGSGDSQGGSWMRSASATAASQNYVTDLVADAAKRADALSKSAKHDLDASRAQPLQHDVQLGGAPHAAHSGGGATPVQPFDDDAIEKTKAYEVVQKQLDATLKGLTDSERTYTDQVDLATSSTDAGNAKLALAKKESEDASVAVGLLTGAVAYDTNELRRQEAARDSAQASLDRIDAAQKSYGSSLGEGTKRTESQRASLEQLNEEHKKAKAALEESKTAIEGVTSALEKNQSALDAAKSKTEEYAKAQAALLRAYNDGTAKSENQTQDSFDTFQQPLEKQREYFAQRIADLDVSDSEYLAHKLEFENQIRAIDLKIAEQPEVVAAEQAASKQQLADEEATYGKSLAQQLAYYQARYAATLGGNEAEQALHKKYGDEINTLVGDEYKERIDAQKAFIESAQSLEETFLGDILTKHQSLRQSLKDIFGDIESDFVKMIEQMIVKSALLNGVNKELASIFNIGATAGGAGGSTAGGIAGGSGVASVFGPSSTQDNPGSNLTVDLGSNTYQALTGSPTGVTSGASSTVSPGGGTIAFGSVDAAGNPVVSPSTGPSFGTYAGGALAGLGIGGVVAGLDGGNAAYGSVGGALGSSLGTFIGTLGGATGGPLGSIIGTVAGSLLGSLFSGNAPTAAKNPDEFEGQTNYGQDVADLQFGQSNANGTSYYPDSAIAKFVAAMDVSAGTINQGVNQGQQKTNSNGTIASSGGVDAAEIWLSQNASDTPAQLEAMGVSPSQFASWQSQLGVSATGSGQYSHIAGDPNIGDIEVTGATSGGNTKTTTATLAADLAAIVTASGNSSSQNSPVFTVSRTMPDMNLGTVSQTGTYDQLTSGINVPLVQSGAPSIVIPGVTPGTSTSGSTTVGTGSASADAEISPIGLKGGIAPVINITVTGDNVLAGDADMQNFTDKIAQQVSISLRRFATGQLFGGLASAASSRTGNR